MSALIGVDPTGFAAVRPGFRQEQGSASASVKSDRLSLEVAGVARCVGRDLEGRRDGAPRGNRVGRSSPLRGETVSSPGAEGV